MYFSDSDSSDGQSNDKSKYNCPYYNKHRSEMEVFEFASMEPSNKKYDLLLKSETENNHEISNDKNEGRLINEEIKENTEQKERSKAKLYDKSAKILNKLFMPITAKMLLKSQQSGSLLRVLNLPDQDKDNQVIDLDEVKMPDPKSQILFGRVILVGYIAAITNQGLSAVFNDHTGSCHLILVKPETFHINSYYRIGGKISDKGYIVVEWNEPTGPETLITHFLQIFDQFEPRSIPSKRTKSIVKTTQCEAIEIVDNDSNNLSELIIG